MMAFFGKNFIRVYLLVLGVLLTVAVYRQYAPNEASEMTGWYGGGGTTSAGPGGRIGFFIAESAGASQSPTTNEVRSESRIPIILGKLLQMVSRQSSDSMNVGASRAGKPISFEKPQPPKPTEAAVWNPAAEPLSDPASGLPYGIQTEGEMALVGRVTEINTPEVCANNRNVTILILVQTSIGNRRARDTIRLSWGGVASHDLKQPVLFVVGRSANATLERNLAEEQSVYGDLIQFDFQDHYHNLTLKSLSCVLWTARYCPQAGFMFKVDDDTFVNANNLVRFGMNHITERGTIFGAIRDDIVPIRDPKHAETWYVPHGVFKVDLFPPYTTGAGYLIGGEAVQKMTALSEEPMSVYPDSGWSPLAGVDTSASRGVRPAINLEDVYINGLLAIQAGVPRVHVPQIHQRFCDMDPCNYATSLTVHHCAPEQISKIWYYIKHFPDTNC